MEFILRACERDSAFQEILIDQLELDYARVLALPSSDLVLSVGAQNAVTFDGFMRPNVSVGLDKLFPQRGGFVSAEMRSSRPGTRLVNDFSVTFGVDIARNAFGRAVQLLDRLTGLEVRIARIQIVEAYEDYLAVQMLRYYDWVSAFERIKAARSSVEEGERFLDNILRKQKSHVAYQVDVDKARFQFLGKRDRLLTTQREFREVSLDIARTLRAQPGEEFAPDSTGWRLDRELWYDAEEEKFFRDSRTRRFLDLLRQSDSLEVDRAADDLLPSARVFAGAGAGDAEGGVAGNVRLFAGMEFSLPFERSREKAALQVSRIAGKKRALATSNILGRLRTDLANLRQQILSQQQAIELAQRRMELAASILATESEDYTYGRTDINDLIQALNNLQEIRFVKINYEIGLDVLKIEWLRLTDQLVRPAYLEKTPVPRLR